MFLQEFFASIRARLRRSTWHRDKDGAEIATRLQELLGKPVESETLSTNAPSRNDPSHPYRYKPEHNYWAQWVAQRLGNRPGAVESLERKFPVCNEVISIY
jgi:hypothetical protein